MARKREVDEIKANGVHYTPPALAQFLAHELTKVLAPRSGTLRVLDPACGDGGLLVAIAQALPKRYRKQLVLTGFEKDRIELEKARQQLEGLGIKSIDLHARDFLDEEDSKALPKEEHFDAVIANPPYVRTQVLGAVVARQLAKQFGLAGRVDLYHAFITRMVRALKPGGALGLLTSNRFLTIKSGATVRGLLRTHVDLKGVFDLGDTRMFSAAVLPVVVIGTKNHEGTKGECSFDRVYEVRNGHRSRRDLGSQELVLRAFQDRSFVGEIQTDAGRYLIERGKLLATNDSTWSLSTGVVDAWLTKVQENQRYTFGEVAQVRVGIKTTADEVFIRNDWDELADDIRPEEELLRPLITHHDAGRWLAGSSTTSKDVLYTHQSTNGKRSAVDLSKYPRGANYLGSFRERLTRRKYVADAGRHWYEIWVPHQPADWAKPKIVFPDISEEPLFFLDQTGSVVNGDCYWITLKDGIDADYLLLMLAVANSTFITKYYDARFHNKLYAGRRRFMTQYVNEFPVPDINSAAAQRILGILRCLDGRRFPTKREESTIETLVRKSFGVATEGIA